MAKQRRNFTLDSDFYCIFCGNKSYGIARRAGSAREAGHLKRLFCLTCGRETNHVECKEFTHYSKIDFNFEKEYGNFDEEGNRILPYGEFRAKIHNEGKELPN